MSAESARSPEKSLELLKEGNTRFVAKSNGRTDRGEAGLLEQLSSGQNPFAVVVGCADSRVPVEVVFDQAPGDVFVVRVAGNIAGPTQAGSVEYAVDNFDCPLVVVLGHSACGAVQATLSDLEERIEGISTNLREIVETIKPAVQGLSPQQVPEGVQANVAQSVHALETGPLAGKVAEGAVQIVGAHYDLATGLVEFY